MLYIEKKKAILTSNLISIEDIMPTTKKKVLTSNVEPYGDNRIVKLIQYKLVLQICPFHYNLPRDLRRFLIVFAISS